MKIISFVNSHSGCDYHRVKLPLTYLHQDGHVTGVTPGQSLEDNLKECDILFYNRMPYNVQLDDILRYRDQYGFKIVVDLDDHWKLYPGHYMEGVWKAQGFEQQILRNLSIADAVICTVDRLYEKILKYNSNVHVVPNGLPFDDLQFTADRKPSDKMRFIYAGGGSHFWDLFMIRNSIARLDRDNFPGEIVLAGIAAVNIYDRMVDVMSNRGRMKNFRSLQYLPLDSYMDLYKEGDVALAPLAKNIFNGHKSNLKVLEAGCKNMPIIVSNNGPYHDENPLTMRVDRPGDWYKFIRFCEQNPSFVTDNGEQLGEYVRRNYHLRLMNYLRLEAFNSVL
jgi:glycosyltransferase involved in cell wall biosynthesis